MPQMSPMNWLWLFFFFNSLFIIVMIINYYSFIYFPHYLNLHTSSNFNNKIWKW
uniref:ATP synthase complex subunit 8 n=1 Tax=Hylastes brunneus TaxID=1117389 RepID=A0A343A6G1_9CUCU|nr:ATP synthase F0 subunit 8 [Hylastes brunneus]AOY40140.1 ATP synthase F0 subunit 8 [Hylastes brunneus]